VIERSEPSDGLFLAAAALVALVIIGLAILWTQPWDDGDGASVPVDPPIIDDSGGGTGDAPAQPNDGGGSGTDGGTDDGGGAPAQ
jgi:hypothetical protein